MESGGTYGRGSSDIASASGTADINDERVGRQGRGRDTIDRQDRAGGASETLSVREDREGAGSPSRGNTRVPGYGDERRRLSHDRRTGYLPTDRVNIYVLIDPRDGAIRYLGRTRTNIEDRLRRHIYDARYAYRWRGADRIATSSHITQWIIELDHHGLEPRVHLVGVVQGLEALRIEHNWIKRLWRGGYNLVNTTSCRDYAEKAIRD